MAKIRVGLWEPTGMWGRAVVRTLLNAAGVTIPFVVYRRGTNLMSKLDTLSLAATDIARLFPGTSYLEGSAADHDAVQNRAGSGVTFQRAELLDHREMADIIVDMTAAGDGGKGTNDYQKFPGPVVAQHSANWPRAPLFAPPFFNHQAGANRFRQTACIISGIAPVLHCFKEGLHTACLHVVMQVDERINDFLTADRLHSSRIVPAYAERLIRELTALLPDVQFAVPSVVQVPALKNYMVTIVFETAERMERVEVEARLRKAPHVCILPESVDVTYHVDRDRASGRAIAPTMVFGKSLQVSTGRTGTRVTLMVGLYSELIAVLPFVDAVHRFGKQLAPLDAMYQTDRDLGISM